MSPEQQRPIRVLLVDDHDVVRRGLVALLDGTGRLRVVGEADSVVRAVTEAERCRPDVVVMDIRLPDGSGVEACREIRARRPETRVVMLTSYADDQAVLNSILAGASGYVLKTIRGRALVEAVETVADGGSLLAPGVAHRVLDLVRGALEPASAEPGLSPQERKVLALVAEGKTNREIAEELCLAEGTVKNYVSGLLAKLQLDRRTQLVAYASRGRLPGGG